MLVFSLVEGSRFVIETPEGRIINGTVVRVDRGKLRLGFEADKAVIIDRAAVAEKRRAERAKAKGDAA